MPKHAVCGRCCRVTGSTGKRAKPSSKRVRRPLLYQKWIDTHGGEEFGALVEAVLGLADNVHEDLNTAQKARVKGLRHHQQLGVDVLGRGLEAGRVASLRY